MYKSWGFGVLGFWGFGVLADQSAGCDRCVALSIADAFCRLGGSGPDRNRRERGHRALPTPPAHPLEDMAVGAFLPRIHLGFGHNSTRNPDPGHDGAHQQSPDLRIRLPRHGYCAFETVNEFPQKLDFSRFRGVEINQSVSVIAITFAKLARCKPKCQLAAVNQASRRDYHLEFERPRRL